MQNFCPEVEIVSLSRSTFKVSRRLFIAEALKIMSLTFQPLSSRLVVWPSGIVLKFIKRLSMSVIKVMSSSSGETTLPFSFMSPFQMTSTLPGKNLLPKANSFL